MRLTYYLILLFFFVSQIGFSQPHVYKHYGLEDGLPSSEVYSAFQDSKGYIWFGTDAGVSRFNGYEFENFDASDGLTGNTVFLITEDVKGRIWFGTFNNQLSYFQNDSIYPFKYNHKIKKDLKVNRAMQSFAIDSANNIWIGYITEGLFKVTSSGNITNIISTDKSEKNRVEVLNVNNKLVFGTFQSRENQLKLRRNFILNGSAELSFELKINQEDTSLVDSLSVRQNSSARRSFNVDKNKSGYWLEISGQLFEIDTTLGRLEINQIKTDLFKNTHITSILSDDNYLWICTTKDGVYQCKIQQDSIVEVNHYFEGESISRVFKDSRSGYWFMSLNKGVHYLSSKEFTNVLIKKGDAILTLELDSIGNELFVGTSNGLVLKLTKKSTGYSFEKIYSSQVPCYSLLYDYSEKSLIVGNSDSSNFLPYYIDGAISYLKTVGPGGHKSMMIENETLYFAESHGIFTLSNDGEFSSTLLDGKEKIWCSSILKFNDKIWVGTKDGIRFYEGKEIVNPFPTNPFLSSTITSLALLSEEILLIGTKSYGVLVVKGNQVIKTINKENGLTSNLVKSLSIDKGGLVWVGTNKGLNKLEFITDTKVKVQMITKKHGLISEDINAIKVGEEFVYLGTPNGLIQFDKTKIDLNDRPPPIYITQFNVNLKELGVRESMAFPYDQNFIKIGFEGINYRSLGQVGYQYRMLGVDTNWTSTMSRLVQYPTLQPGDYQFEVRAENENGYWSEPVSISFTISSPFWLTWWFISLEILLGIGILSGIFWYRERQIKAKGEVSKKMIELELKALRSQMNPHFIFNTLNSIQHYIAVNDFRSTNKYIVQFATLIRTILHLSEKSVITIQEEIDILTMYMDLEKMRFEEQFDYKIEVSDEIDKDYDEIPSMLLQPYIENAIWHGLMNKNGKGQINIRITEEGEYLCCLIEDNGIGREKAAEIKAKRNIQQKSIGMSVTKERLDLISNNDVNVEIIDLYDDNGKSAGTRMLIKILYKS